MGPKLRLRWRAIEWKSVARGPYIARRKLDCQQIYGDTGWDLTAMIGRDREMDGITPTEAPT